MQIDCDCDGLESLPVLIYAALSAAKSAAHAKVKGANLSGINPDGSPYRL